MEWARLQRALDDITYRTVINHVVPVLGSSRQRCWHMHVACRPCLSNGSFAWYELTCHGSTWPADPRVNIGNRKGVGLLYGNKRSHSSV